MFKQENYQKYLAILPPEELNPVLDCTKPISVAYGAALAKKYLKGAVKSLTIKSTGTIKLTGAILKNAKRIVAPSPNKLKSTTTSKLEVLANITKKDIQKFMDSSLVMIEHLDNPVYLHTIITAENDEHKVEVEFKNWPTDFLQISVDDRSVHYQKLAIQQCTH